MSELLASLKWVTSATSPGTRAAAWGPVIATAFALFFAAPLGQQLAEGRPVSWPAAAVFAAPPLVALVALRRREAAPVQVALLIAVLLAICPTAMGAAFVAQEAVARRSRVAVAVLTAGVFLLAQGSAGVLSAQPSVATALYFEWAVLVAGVAIATLAGLLSVSRRQASESRGAARRAEEDALAARLNEARLAERERIAREMHDVVAHRITLVAMHAGALARNNLSADDAREASRLVQVNAQASLEELRAMLVTLRGADAPPAPRQPTLQELAVLVAEAEEAGQSVVLEGCGDLESLPTPVSRHLFRIIQEAVTNARKHAPGAPVTVTLERRRDVLEGRIANPLADLAPPDRSGAGFGLAGVAERVALLGGQETHGVRGRQFVLQVAVPLAEPSLVKERA